MERKVHVSALCVAKKDWINELPDEILITILSFLPLKEAVRSSTLSQRWVNLWKFTPNLDLDFDETGFLEYFTQIGRYKEHFKVEIYTSWVNQVLKSHRGSTITKFKLRHDFDKYSGYIVDSLIEFAFERKVQRFELDFRSRFGHNIRWGSAYAFPKSIFDSTRDFSNLTFISLISVSLTDEIVSSLFTACIFLERLTIINSFNLCNLSIKGHLSPKLSYLEIETCVDSIVISGINLTVFKYKGHARHMSLTNLPALTKCTIGGLYMQYLIIECSELPFWFLQLQKLVIDINFFHPMDYERSIFYSKSFPKFEKLEHLELEACVHWNESLVFLDPFIEASPKLKKLVLKLIHEEPPEQMEIMEDVPNERRIRSVEPWLLQELEILEFLGWRGYKDDVDYIVHIYEHSPRLSKVIVDPRHPRRSPLYIDLEAADEELSRKRVSLLEEKLSPNIELVVL